MKRVPIAEFKANCSRYVSEAATEDIVITKHGKAVARVVRAPEEDLDIWEFYRSLAGKYEVLGDVMSTGRRWDAQS